MGEWEDHFGEAGMTEDFEPWDYGNDNNNEKMPKNKNLEFNEYPLEVDNNQLLLDIINITNQNSETDFTAYWTPEYQSYFEKIDNWGGDLDVNFFAGMSLESENLNLYCVHARTGDQLPDESYRCYTVSLRMFIKALIKTKKPAIVNDNWTTWDSQNNSISIYGGNTIPFNNFKDASSYCSKNTDFIITKNTETPGFIAYKKREIDDDDIKF